MDFLDIIRSINRLIIVSVVYSRYKIKVKQHIVRGIRRRQSRHSKS